MTPNTEHKRSHPLLRTLAALGVVFGDIGTSPLYALRECFGPHGAALTPDNILGIVSLILWSLLVVISVKYLLFVMRADNRGEGGILALMALALDRMPSDPKRLRPVVALGLFGAALLYGDGIITPAISVLSAVEGLEIALPSAHAYVQPIAALILILLFSLQRFGTAGVGKIFGPVMLLWFGVIAFLGASNISGSPEIFAAVNPMRGLAFLMENGYHGLFVLGSVVLVVTGGEALYADMGHFGRKPIQWGWFTLALPALVLQYFGQGALLLREPAALSNPFYHLAPEWALIPLIVLSTLATVIASQAMLTGAFSLTHQAVQLGYLPHIRIKHTSAKEIGQIYVPFVNWAMLLGTLVLVLEFKSSHRLAAAYGIAVTGTMVITTILLYVVTHRVWAWPKWLSFSVVTCFLVPDLGFFAANVLKIPHGGWLPLVLACVLFFLMVTWKRGRALLAEYTAGHTQPLETFLNGEAFRKASRVSGNAVYLTEARKGVPSALLRNVKYNQVVHENIVFCTVVFEEIPFVARENRVEAEELAPGIHRLTAHYGFMDIPDVPEALSDAVAQGLDLSPAETTYVTGRHILIATKLPGMAIWREEIVVFLTRNSEPSSAFFKLPAEQVFELGMVIEI